MSEAFGFGPSTLAAAASIADPATHLTVVRQDRFVGFRSDAAGGKMLQARKRGASKLCFYNANFGINEQWEVSGGHRASGGDGAWRSATLRLVNRRLPSFVLRVDVMRVPEDMLAPPPGFEPARERADRRLMDAPGVFSGYSTDDTPPPVRTPMVAGDDSDAAWPTLHPLLNVTPSDEGGSTATATPRGETPGDERPDVAVEHRAIPVRRMVAHHEKAIAGGGHGGARGSARDRRSSEDTPHGRPPPGHKRDGTGEEQGNALRSMSGVLIKEWSAFVLKEVRARKDVEREMLELREEMRKMATSVREDINYTRQEWISDASFYGSEVRGVYEAMARQQEATVKLARRTFARRHMMSAMKIWGAHALEFKIRRVAFRRGMARMLRAREAAPFLQWRDKARHIAHCRRILVKVAAINYRRVGTATLRAWANRVAGLRSARVDAREISRRRVRQYGRRALTNWRLKACRGRGDHVMACVIRRSFAQLQRRALAASFGAWASRAKETRTLRVIATRVVVRNNRRLVHASAREWHRMAKIKHHRRRRLSTLVMRVLARQLREPFVAWHRGMRRRRVRARVVRAFTLRIVRGTLSRSFRLWASVSGARSAKRRRVYDFSRRVFAKWAAGAAARAFQRWCAACAKKRAVRRKARVFVLRSRSRVVSASFTAWATYTLAILAAKDNAMLFLVRMMRSHAHKALRRWRDASRDLRHRRSVLTSMVAKWSSLHLAASFRGWHGAVTRIRSQRRRLTAIVWRVKHAAVASAFATWFQVTQRLQRQRETALRVGSTFVHRAMSGAFKGWLDAVETRKDRVAKARRIVQRMRNLKKHAALVAWVTAVERRKEQRALASRVVARMNRVKLAAAFNTLTKAVEEARRVRAQLERAARFVFGRSSDRAKNVLRLWHDEAARQVSFRRRAVRAVSRIRLSVLARALDKWLENIKEMQLLDRLTEKARAHFATYLGRELVRAWHTYASMVRREHGKMRKALKRLGALRSHQALSTWRVHVSERRLMALHARRADKAWRRVTMGAAWRKWRSDVAEARAALRLALHNHKMHAAAMRVKVARAAFSGWMKWSAEYRRLANLVSKGYAQQQRLYKRWVWNSWVGFIEEAEARRDKVSRCVTSKRMVTKWFLDWYWQAFEGDIASALGLITGNCDDVIGAVYGERRMLGQSFEVASSPPRRRGEGSASGNWFAQHDAPLTSGLSPGTPRTPFTPRYTSPSIDAFVSASRGERTARMSASTLASASDAADDSFMSAGGGSSVAASTAQFTPGGFSGGYRLGGDSDSVASDTPHSVHSSMSDARKAWMSAAALLDDQDVE